MQNLTDQPASAAVNGDDHAAAPRPYWQDQPCLPWCMMVVPHRDADATADRYHLGPIHEVNLTLEDAAVIPIPGPGGEITFDVSLPFINAGLCQPWRDHEPRVVLCHSATHDIELTVAEASELAEALAALVRQAGVS